MRKLLLLVGLVAFICSPAMAGKNANGALVVHTDDAINYTFFAPPDYCAIFPYDGGNCADLNPTSSFVDPNFLLGALVYYVAAFPLGSAPGVTVVFFGHDHNFAPGFISGWSFCGPPNSLEVPDAGWPDDTNAGNSVGFGSAIAGDLIFPFYWLGVYGDVGNYIGPRINPTGGYAGFVSDDNPGVLDEIFNFGTCRWFPEEGDNGCAVPPEPEACCFYDGSCLFELPVICLELGGEPQGPGTDCDPNFCPPPPWACCFEDGSCVVLGEEDCFAQGGLLWIEDVLCDPNPCAPLGACCFTDGTCLEITEEDCSVTGGEVWFGLETCDPNPCPPAGACCFADGSCIVMREIDCTDAGGAYWIFDVSCDPNPCEPIATENTTWGTIKANYK